MRLGKGTLALEVAAGAEYQIPWPYSKRGFGNSVVARVVCLL